MELSARTKTGADLVELAEELAPELAEGVARHDREGVYLEDHLRTLVRRGWLAAAVPEELGGRGVASVHDLFVAASRLARGDAASTIGASMHVVVVVNLVRSYRTAGGAERQALRSVLEELTGAGTVISAAISEPGQDLTRPSTEATPVNGGWRVDGRKIFCTMSPAADVFLTSVRMPTPRGERYGYVLVPAGAPGVVVHDDWDALGMRTSGSNSVTFTGVRVDDTAVLGTFPLGSAAGMAARNLAAGGFHAAAALGIAESAHAVATERLRARAPDAAGRAVLADSELDLHAARAALARAGETVDDHHDRFPMRTASDEAVLEVFSEVQAAKAVVSAAAMRVVDRALLLSGGSGYRAGTALARAVGDVRALMFMNPLSTTRTSTLLADLALGLAPTLA